VVVMPAYCATYLFPSCKEAVWGGLARSYGRTPMQREAIRRLSAFMASVAVMEGGARLTL